MNFLEVEVGSEWKVDYFVQESIFIFIDGVVFRLGLNLDDEDYRGDRRNASKC